MASGLITVAPITNLAAYRFAALSDLKEVRARLQLHFEAQPGPRLTPAVANP